MYRPEHPASAPDLIPALRRLIDALVDGSAMAASTDSLDTVYAAINYLAAAEHLCAGCGRPLLEDHAARCRHADSLFTEAEPIQ